MPPSAVDTAAAHHFAADIAQPAELIEPPISGVVATSRSPPSVVDANDAAVLARAFAASDEAPVLYHPLAASTAANDLKTFGDDHRVSRVVRRRHRF